MSLKLLLFQLLITFATAATDPKDLFNSGNVQFAPGAIAVLCIVGGVVLCFYGYYLFRPALFTAGFIVGSIIAYTAMTKVSGNLYAAWGAFLIGGLLLGFLVLKVYSLGVFIIGAAAGVLLAFFLHNSFGYRLYPSNPDIVLYVMVVVLALIGGALALCLQKPFLIVATSFFGADASVWGIGYFAGNYPNGCFLDSLKNANDTIDMPPEWWIYFAATLLLFIAGMYVQFQITSKDIDHHSSSRSIPEDRNYTTQHTPKQQHPVQLV